MENLPSIFKYENKGIGLIHEGDVIIELLENGKYRVRSEKTEKIFDIDGLFLYQDRFEFITKIEE